jgi:Glutamate-1-semialdehyde aminotransferase
MFSVFFSNGPVENYADLKKCDTKRFARFYRKLLESGIYMSPSQGEANFLSITHSKRILNKVKVAFNQYL